MEFKGTEIFETVKGIYEYTGVTHDDETIYGVLTNSDKKEESFKFSEVLRVWRKVESGERQLTIPDVSVAKQKLPTPFEIWIKAAKENAIDFEIWLNKFLGN